MKRNWINNESEQLATEAIAHQGRSELFGAIEAAINETRKLAVVNESAITASGLAATIHAKCGISVKFIVSEDPMPNAAVMVPQLDASNPIVAKIQRIFMTNADLTKATKLTGDDMIGTVDRKDAKVYGAFSKLVCPVYLTTGILEDNMFSDGEIAAVILHELGHIFSYFEHLIDMVSMQYAVVAASDAILGLERDVDRIKVVEEYEKQQRVSIADKEKLVKSNSKENLHVVLSSSTFKERRNAEGNEVYSYRGFEFSADQFATRHGAGASLVSALDKMQRYYLFNSSYMSWPAHIFLEIFRLVNIILAAALVPVFGVLWIVYLIVARPMNKIYDDPRGRMERIKNEMVAELKNKRLPSFRRDEILRDLAIVREFTDKLSDKAGILEAIWKYVTPGGNAARKQTEFQEGIEELTNNDLYIASALFK